MAESVLCAKCKQAPAETSGGTPLCPPCWFVKIAKRALGSREYGETLKQQWRRQGGRCAYTGQPLLMGQTASLDHKRPTSRGGSHTPGNLHWVTQEINFLKANRTHEEFVRLIVAIARHLQVP